MPSCAWSIYFLSLHMQIIPGHWSFPKWRSWNSLNLLNCDKITKREMCPRLYVSDNGRKRKLVPLGRYVVSVVSDNRQQPVDTKEKVPSNAIYLWEYVSCQTSDILFYRYILDFLMIHSIQHIFSKIHFAKTPVWSRNRKAETSHHQNVIRHQFLSWQLSVGVISWHMNLEDLITTSGAWFAVSSSSSRNNRIVCSGGEERGQLPVSIVLLDINFYCWNLLWYHIFLCQLNLPKLLMFRSGLLSEEIEGPYVVQKDHGQVSHLKKCRCRMCIVFRHYIQKMSIVSEKAVSSVAFASSSSSTSCL